MGVGWGGAGIPLGLCLELTEMVGIETQDIIVMRSWDGELESIA